MEQKYRVFDNWGNYIGTFTKESSFGQYGWIFIIIFLVPILWVFYMVNFFRICKRLIEKGEVIKTFLWCLPWPIAPIVYGIGALLVKGLESSGSQLANILAGLGCLLMPVMAIGTLVQWYFVFKYSNLDF
jgi:hypothetical protein